jgi:hypothetical protein
MNSYLQLVTNGRAFHCDEACGKISEFQDMAGKVKVKVALCMLIQYLKGFWEVDWI